VGDQMNALRKAGVSVGQFPPGERCAISDVPGVLVGHHTVCSNEGDSAVRTGVTAILPPGDLYEQPLPAGVFVLHGFGKAVGLWQVDHMGVLETPVLFTNTLSTFRCADALVGWTVDRHPRARSVNPVVLECNDGWLSAIESRAVSAEHVRAALTEASADFAEGCVGAGTGMVAYELKSGIGTASCAVDRWTMGALAMPNMGRREDLLFVGRPLELSAVPRIRREEAGSVVVVLATDAPVSPRQLGMLARRGALGLARTGAPADTGSGDFVVAFSTSYRFPRKEERVPVELVGDHSSVMSRLVRAAAQVAEEAVLSALLAARTTTGRGDRTVHALPHSAVG